MKKKKTETASSAAIATAMAKPRTVKISDKIHYKIRVLSAQMEMPMQQFIENMLVAGLRDKVYEKFAATEKAAA